MTDHYLDTSKYRDAGTTRIADVTTNYFQLRSTKMFAMYEALARERMRDEQDRARQARVVREFAAQRRWHRVTLRAQAAERRHAHRLDELLVR